MRTPKARGTHDAHCPSSKSEITHSLPHPRRTARGLGGSVLGRLAVVVMGVLVATPAWFPHMPGAPTPTSGLLAPPIHARLTSTPVPAPLITFTGPTEYSYGTMLRPDPNPTNVAIADLNGDGKMDMVLDDSDATASNYSVRVEFGDGAGGFSESAGYLVTNLPGRLVVKDLNGDGHPDIVVGQGSAGIAVLLNNGDGTFSSPSYYSITWPSGSSGGAVDGLAVGDLDGDGKLDVVTGDGALSGIPGYGHPQGFYSVFLGNGDGTFATPTTYGPVIPSSPINGGGQPVNGIALGDFDHDGKLDMAIAAGANTYDGPSGVEIVLGNGTGSFNTPPEFHAVGNYYQSTDNISIGDFNRDGFLDIAVSNGGCGYADGSDTTILTNNGDGAFTVGQNLGNSCVVGNQVVTDLNGDGVPDLIIVTGDSPYDATTFLHVFIGVGDGTFADAGEFATSTGYGSDGIAAGDLNGDSVPDLVTANGGGSVWGSSHDMSIFLNTSPQGPIGGPIRPAELPGGFCAACVAASQQNTSKPVDSSTGDFWHTFSDVSIPGRGIPLTFNRTYNANDAATNGPLGYGWTFSFNTSLSVNGTSGVVTVNEETGGQEVFDPASGGGYTAPPRVMATLVHNMSGTWTLVVRNQTTYTFNSSGQLTSEEDLNGYTTSLTYSSGELTTITDPEGRTFSIGWTSGHITTVTDTNVTPNRTVTFEYNDGNGNLTDVINVNGGHTEFAYDSNHRLTHWYDPNCYTAGSACNSGNGLVNVYNTAGEVTSQTDDMGRETTFSYTGNPEFSSTTTITDPMSNIEVDSYSYGELVEVTKGSGTAASASWVYAYDPSTTGVTSVTDPNGHTATTTYDALGDVLSTLDPLSRTTSATYNSFGEPLTKEDGAGVTTTYTYNTDGDLTSVSTPLTGTMPLQHRVTNYDYADGSHPGDVTSMEDPNGQTWTYTYNSHGYRQTVEDPLGNVATTCYTAIGWITATYTPLAGSITCANPPPTSPYRTRYTYVEPSSATDEFGDVQKVTDPLGHVTEYTYDADRNVVTETDGDSNTTTYVYDLDNEQTEIERADSPQTTLITDYNADGTVNYQKDGKGNKTLTYGYDSLGRVTSEEDADSHTTTYSLDGDGNVLTTQIPGGNCSAGPPTGCITNTYDADDELKTVTYSDGTTPNVSNLTYDGDGRRLTMTDGTGTTTDGYDSLGRLASEQNGAGVTVSYGYDLKDQLISITYPGTHTVDYGYDNAGRLTTVADWLGNTTTYTPDANSFDAGIAYQNGVNVTQTPDDANQNMGITAKLGSTTLASMTYTRDSNNQVTGESDTGVTQVAQPFTYTPLNQVKDAGTPSYSYDAADNLTKLTSGTNQLFDPADELCWSSTSTGSSCSSPPSGATTYTYDDSGNRTTSTHGSSTITYGYDEANRLTAYTSATEAATYAYDGDGLRMSKTVNGTTTPFTWDTATSTPLLLSDGTTDYIYGLNGTPIEQETVQPSISLIGEGSGTGGTGTSSITVNFPTGYHVGDEIYVATTQSDTTTVTAPSAYTLITSATSGGTSPKAGTDVYQHAIASGESSVTISYSGTSSVKAVVLGDYRGVDTTLPVDVYSSSTTAGGTTVVAPSVSPAYANDRLLIFQGSRGTFSSKSWTAPTGTTEEVQINSQANVSTGLADLALTSSGATGTKTSTFGASANLTTIIVAIPQPPSVLFYQSDQLGSTRLLTDTAGVVRGTFSYDAYGNLIGSTGSYSTPLGYVGQFTDLESGLVYLQARYYDPTTGQFLTRDPMLATSGVPYAYVDGNPLNLRDSTGLMPVDPGTVGETAAACAGTAEVPVVGELACGATAVEGGADLISLIAGAIGGSGPSGPVSWALESDLAFNFTHGTSPVCVFDAIIEAEQFVGPGGQWEGTSGGFQYRRQVTQGGHKFQIMGRLDIDPNNLDVRSHGPHLNLDIHVEMPNGSYEPILNEHYAIDPNSYTYSGP